MRDGYTQWLERQLAHEFSQDEIAETGARVMAATPSPSGDGIDRYDYALRLTLVALRTRRDGHPPLDWMGGPSLWANPRLLRVRRALTDELDHWGIAAGGLYACVACEFMRKADVLLGEPTA